MTVEQAMSELSRDPVLAAHIASVGRCKLRPRMGGLAHFEQLAQSIAYQQLAGKAAASIWRRVRALVPGPFSAADVLLLTEAELRGAGLSMSKVLSLRDLAAHVDDGRLTLSRVGRLDDELVIEMLCKVRGIGRWTAEMFLMFQLGRLDVWPVGDFGVRNGYRVLYELPEMPTVAELGAFGERFAPWRSVAAWYMWRAADAKLPTGRA